MDQNGAAMHPTNVKNEEISLVFIGLRPYDEFKNKKQPLKTMITKQERKCNTIMATRVHSRTPKTPKSHLTDPKPTKTAHKGGKECIPKCAATDLKMMNIH